MQIIGHRRSRAGGRIVTLQRAANLSAVGDSGLLVNADAQLTFLEAHIVQRHAGGGVEVACLHRLHDLGWVQAGGAHHHPAAAGAVFLTVVAVRVIRAHAIQRRGFEFRDAQRVGHVPNLFMAHARGVAGVVDGGVAVVDLPEILFQHCRQILGGKRPSEVRVIDVREHRHSEALGLLVYHLQIRTHHFLNAGEVFYGLDLLFEIYGVEMDRDLAKAGADLLRLDEQELARLFKLGAVLLQLLQPHLGFAIFDTRGHPFVAKASAVFFHRGLAEGLAALLDGGLAHPHLLRLQHVVVGDGQEVVAVLLVPVRDHLRKIVPITPERMRVCVALEPARLCGGGGVDQSENEKAENGWAHHTRTHRNYRISLGI